MNEVFLSHTQTFCFMNNPYSCFVFRFNLIFWYYSSAKVLSYSACYITFVPVPLNSSIEELFDTQKSYILYSVYV